MLFALLLFHPWPLLVGYWFGAAMHLTFDVLVNGEYAIKRPLLFYVLSYRACYGFSARELLDPKPLSQVAGERPILEFFQWRPSVQPDSPKPQVSKIADSPENAV